MPTQEAKFPAVPFSLTEPLQHVRLLEVPEELLDIIVNTKQNVCFKSAAPTSHNGNGVGGKEGHLHLCTDNKVWAVKQVSTSNSIHVARISSTEQILNDGGVGGDDGSMDVDDPDGEDGSGLGLTAFAKPSSILELHAVHPVTYDAVVQEHLNTLVPTVASVEDIATASLSNSYSLRELCNHIPAPFSLIQRILAQKCVFEMTRPGTQQSKEETVRHHTYIPSPRLLLSTWTEIINTAIVNSKDTTNIEDIRSLFYSDNDLGNLDNNTKSICNAITSRLFDPTDGHLASIGILTKTSQGPTLNPRECTRWVGNLIVGVASSKGTDIPKLIFEKDWEDTVPADWIKYCSVEVLQPSCEVKMVDGEDVVSWRPFVLEEAGAGKNGSTSGKEAGAAATAVGAGTAPAKNKRKWHEKFAAQRDAKR